MAYISVQKGQDPADGGMEFSAKNKAKGGKLVYVKLSLDGGRRIRKAQIFGDFFAYPEEAIAIIESSLSDKSVDDKEGLIRSIEKAVRDCRAELVGLTPRSIVETIGMAVGE